MCPAQVPMNGGKKKITKITITKKQLFTVQIRHYRASCFSLKHSPTLLTQQNSHATQNYELLKPKSLATPDKPQGGDRKSPGTPPSSPRRAPFDTDRPTYTKKKATTKDHTFPTPIPPSRAIKASKLRTKSPTS